jgi:hypothetical protein
MVVRRDPDDLPTVRDLCAQLHERLDRVDETLRLTHTSPEDSTLPETCLNIEKQLIHARQELHRIEETVRRSEGIVAEWLQEISTSMTARFAEVEETTQRIATMVSRPVDLPAESVAAIGSPESPGRGVLHRFVDRQTSRIVRLPWLARLAVPVLALVVAFAGGALLTASRSAASENVVSLASTDQTPSVVAPATVPVAATPSIAEPRADAIPPTIGAPVSTPQRSRNRAAAALAPRPTAYVGSLSIASVPPGASVSINGKAAGVTPLRLHRQRAGSLAVQVAEEGFERWSAAVRVSADRLTEVTAKLRPIAP